MPSKAPKVTPPVAGFVTIKKETLYGMVDDVERLNVDGLMLVLRAKSTSTAKQIIDLVDLRAAPVVTRTIKTKIGRGVTGVELSDGALLVGGHHGYSVVDLKTSKAQSLALDEKTQCSAFSRHGETVLFAQLADDAQTPPGFYSHPLGASLKALKKVSELAKRTTTAERNWSHRDPSLATPQALFHRGEEISVVTDEGVVTFDARTEQLTEKRRVVLGVVDDFVAPELFGPQHVVLKVGAALCLVDLVSGASTQLFNDGDQLEGVCRDGNRVYSASFETAELRSVSIENGTVRELSPVSFAFAKPNPKEAEYPFNDFWVTGGRVVVMNHLKSGFLFDLPVT